MEKGLTIKLLDKSTLDQQIKVYMHSFDINMQFDQIAARWKKEHYANSVHEAYIFGAFDGNKLVSINAYMPMKYRYNNIKCNVIQSCVSGTLPEYRGRGIWSRLVGFAISYFKNEGIYDFLIGFPNYRNSYEGFLKMNWSHDSDAINYLMVVNGKNLMKMVTNRNIPLSGFLGVQKVRINLTDTSAFHMGKEIYITETDDGEGFSLMEDESFINWKKLYKGLECFGVYTFDEKPIANCRYFVSSYQGYKIVKLCNVKFIDKTKRKLTIYAYCIKEIVKKHNDIAFIRVWAMDGSSFEKIYRHLFFAKVSNSKHANPFITFSLKDDVVPKKVLHEKENWFNMTFLDLD